MAYFERLKETKYTYTHDGVKFHYDTAKELGGLMVQAGVRCLNPYDPDCTDYDDFNEAVWAARQSHN